MIDKNEILKRLSLMTEIGEDMHDAAEVFCGEAALELSEKLRSPDFAGDARVIAAAAAAALEKLSFAKQTDEGFLRSFKAGDVSVTRSGGEEKLGEILRSAMLAAAPCLSDGEFYFRGV